MVLWNSGQETLGKLKKLVTFVHLTPATSLCAESSGGVNCQVVILSHVSSPLSGRQSVNDSSVVCYIGVEPHGEAHDLLRKYQIVALN